MRTDHRMYKLYCCLAAVGVTVASWYPLSMGVRVVADMLRQGTVNQGDYPKYVIPYTPISLALIVGVLFMPLWIKLCKKWAWAVGSAVSLAVFAGAELALEQWVVVSTVHGEWGTVPLENWQMYMCAVMPDQYETRTWVETNVLSGEYSPAYKLHFYFISAVLILALIHVLYGFARMVKTGPGTGERKGLRMLVMQASSAALLLGLCILACFTAFFRDGELTVSPLSAFLMILFFVVLGLTAGVYVGSMIPPGRRVLSVALPAACASLAALTMYIGEMILLHGHLYIFGSGFFFESLGALVLAPVDILTILLPGALCADLMATLFKKHA